MKLESIIQIVTSIIPIFTMIGFFVKLQSSIKKEGATEAKIQEDSERLKKLQSEYFENKGQVETRINNLESNQKIYDYRFMSIEKVLEEIKELLQKR